MIPHPWNLYLLLTLIFINYPADASPCTDFETSSPVLGKYCTSQIDCLNYVNFDVKTWNCITHRSRRQHYDYYYDRRAETVTYDDTYNLIITIKEPRVKNLFLVNVQNFIKVSLEDGDLLSIPEEVYTMTRLSEVKISGNNISTVNFNNFLRMPELNEINLANNMISVIELDEEKEASIGSQLSNVQTIDISNNLIKIIPNNFASRFIKLQDLNLSHNMISTIGILTFEGIVQLQTLNMSHNHLLEIGNALARFTNLRKLLISNNNLTNLRDYNLNTLISLELLNASSNNIVEIESNAFQSLAKLEVLDLAHNKLVTISEQMFKNNAYLHSLSLMDNKIQSIASNSFKNNRLTDFCVQNNRLTGFLKKNTFKGINANELNLSGGNLTSIQNEVFSDMLDLNRLNISSNAISNISYSAFSSLASLNILDLSYNQLNELNFDSSSLKNMSKLYANHNKIEKITKNVFQNFVSLKELDLSYNNIKKIESQTFLELNNVELITLTGSIFFNTLESKTFEGLASLKKIDMSLTRTTHFQNESFSGCTALTHLNSSFGQLAEIEHNAFLRTGSLEVLTLSNNQLHYFHVNTSSISQIQEIYLNNNNLRNVSSDNFSNLKFLRNLNLANNHIIQLNSDAFQNSNSLMYIDLSSNTRMKIEGNPFQNLNELNSLSLQNVKTDITFKNSGASIEVLDFQSCGISDLNKVYIFNVRGISYLNLSMNELTIINKDSFKQMPSLVSLDLSSNNIMYIQPGSFLHVKRLTSLNLFGNNLPSIQFGVFDGTIVLKKLNLSSNVLTSFDVKLLPVFDRLSLDDNMITNLNFKDYFDTEISELSIGGNQISCKVLAELKDSNFSEKFLHIVTATTLNYHSENVNGISCKTPPNDVPTIIPIANNPSINISPLISSLSNSIDKLGKSLQVIGDTAKKSDDLNDEARIIVKTLDDFIKSSNKNQIKNSDFLNKLTDINNNSNIQLEEIKNYLMGIADNKRQLEHEEGTSNARNSMDEQNMRLEFQKMLKQENDALREEFRIALASNPTRSAVVPSQESLVAPDKESGDTKAVFYFIAVCFAVLLAAYIGNIIFSYVTASRRSRRSNSYHNSATPISNSMEME